MHIERTFFYYERSRKQQAKVLVFNMLFLPLILWLIWMLISKNEPFYDEFLFYIKYIVVVSELALLSLAAWLLTHPAKFYIKLTNSELSSFHPTFKEWTFSVNPQDIIEIEHSTDIGANASLISVKMNNGSSVLLSPNYPYKRSELYDALRLVNPNIKTPKNTWSFPYKK
ncbi:hypothetical protein [Shewanella sp.]|uniref:hypothetical protein n=1 Tax=Shewanella sp. TaxID=50422 RepID=UPI001C72DAEC|nr:hypothetical protein [Shewanella sp.]QYX63612.1 hypothetical protein K2227_15680 [Shewanella putrefaciens]